MRSLDNLTTSELDLLLEAISRFDVITDRLLPRMDSAANARNYWYDKGNKEEALRHHAIIRGCLDQAEAAQEELEGVFQSLDVPFPKDYLAGG